MVEEKFDGREVRVGPGKKCFAIVFHYGRLTVFHHTHTQMAEKLCDRETVGQGNCMAEKLHGRYAPIPI